MMWYWRLMLPQYIVCLLACFIRWCCNCETIATELISGADGTFDILKYADPELDLDDPNLIDSLDLMDDPKASSGEGEGEGEDKKDDDDSKSDDKKALER